MAPPIAAGGIPVNPFLPAGRRAATAQGFSAPGGAWAAVVQGRPKATAFLRPSLQVLETREVSDGRASTSRALPDEDEERPPAPRPSRSTRPPFGLTLLSCFSQVLPVVPGLHRHQPRLPGESRAAARHRGAAGEKFSILRTLGSLAYWVLQNEGPSPASSLVPSSVFRLLPGPGWTEAGYEQKPSGPTQPWPGSVRKAMAWRVRTLCRNEL